MIIDAHFHLNLYPEHFGKDSAERNLPKGINWATGEEWKLEDMNVTADWAVQQMDRIGIDKAFLFGNAQMLTGWIVPTEFIIEAVEKYPDRFVGFVMPNPMGGLKTVREIENAVKGHGFKGVKLIPTYNRMYPNDRRMWPIFEIAQELDLPVTVHTGWGPYSYHRLEWQRPDYLHEVADEFPDLKVILAHCGMQWSEEAILMLWKLPNFYADFAYWGFLPIDKVARTLVLAKAVGVWDKLLWGTDFPWTDPEADIQKYRRIPEYTRQYGLEPHIDDAEIDMLLGGNAARLMGIEES